jgi:hypothetical protein
MSRLLIVLGIGLVAVPSAMAQTRPTSRGYIAINGSYQLTSTDFTDRGTKRENAEEARFDAAYEVKTGPGFDVAGGGMLRGRLGVGIGISRFSVSTPTAFRATVPHPFFFNRDRSISADITDLHRTELAVHIQARGVFPLGARAQAEIFGGPSVFRVTQGVITDYTITESFPYDEASFRSAVTETAHVSKLGANVGADLTYFVTERLGVGGGFQFSGTTVELPSAAGATQDVRVGGPRVNGGIRLRF